MGDTCIEDEYLTSLVLVLICLIKLKLRREKPMKYYTNNSYKQMHACFSSTTNHICPEKLYLDITEDCNLYCRMCRDELCIKGKTMNIQLFKRVVDETIPYVKSYSLFNWGEPLLVKDFKERVLYINEHKNADTVVEISTNGMLLSDDMIKFLCDEMVIVTVSFDGANKETFEYIRRGSNFEHICGNIERLVESYKGVVSYQAPGIYVSIQKDNVNQLRDIAKLAYELGIKRMGFGLVTSPPEYAPEINNDLREEIEGAAKFLDEHGMLNDLYPTRVGDYLWSGNQYIHKDNFILNSICNAPQISASIGYNGDVYLCCNVGEYVDNINTKSFLELWSSKRYDELRYNVNSEGYMPMRCRHCTWFNRV